MSVVKHYEYLLLQLLELSTHRRPLSHTQLSMFHVLLNFCKGHPCSLSVKEVGEESPWELWFAVLS